MSPFLFWIFALLSVIFGAAVVVNRNPVASALSLVVSFLGLSALFMSLDAYFVGIIQVLVYAGAVMVLFLFIIMLLNLRTEEGRRINWLASAGGVAHTAKLVLVKQESHTSRGRYGDEHGQQETSNSTHCKKLHNGTGEY